MALAELTISAGEAALLNAFPPTEAGDAARAQIAADGLPNRRPARPDGSARRPCRWNPRIRWVSWPDPGLPSRCAGLGLCTRWLWP